MDKVTPRTPSGFMELLPADQLVFNGMLDTIRQVYELFGFTPIETPAIELSSVLLAKGGGETEKQVYRFTKGRNDLCLHYDLTVPLARYVAEHYSDIVFPFRRYQLQKVWRAERPQKGRFREFYQCDIDVIGSDDPLVDAEIPAVIYAVFTALGFDRFTIRINNRKILNGFMEALGIEETCRVLRIIDKLEKLSKDAIKEELIALNIPETSVEKIFKFVAIKGCAKDAIRQLKNLDIDNAQFEEGVRELEAVTSGMEALNIPQDRYIVDLTIARGLDYYTGTVYETVLDDYPSIGSVCSGGRYDNLASYYTDAKLPGVGISIGLTRLFDQLKSAGLIKSGPSTPSRVLIVDIGNNNQSECLNIASQARNKGIPTETFFSSTKLSKQLKYANRLGIRYVIVVGMSEAKPGEIALKDMQTKEQVILPINEALTTISTGS